MLSIAEDAYDRLRRHGEAAYPKESCGVLIGEEMPEGKHVVHAVPVENTAESPRNRYEISPLDMLRIERTARAEGLEIAGFYHSHPDHPAKCSQTDLKEAHWLGYSYLITEILDGEAGETRSFYLAGSGEEEKHFQPEELILYPQRS